MQNKNNFLSIFIQITYQKPTTKLVAKIKKKKKD